MHLPAACAGARSWQLHGVARWSLSAAHLRQRHPASPQQLRDPRDGDDATAQAGLIGKEAKEGRRGGTLTFARHRTAVESCSRNRTATAAALRDETMNTSPFCGTLRARDDGPCSEVRQPPCQRPQARGGSNSGAATTTATLAPATRNGGERLVAPVGGATTACQMATPWTACSLLLLLSRAASAQRRKVEST